MRSIEELRPLIKKIYPNGIWIGHVQPLSGPSGLIFAMRSHYTGEKSTYVHKEQTDIEKWPIPKDVSDAGISPEEWAAYAKKAWSEWFSGGPDGTVLTAMGTITPEAHEEIQNNLISAVNKIVKRNS